jgi:hypothetical protein
MTDKSAFDSASAFPEEAPRDPRHDNQPPLQERILMEFDEALDKEGITSRIADLLSSAGRVPEISSDAIAGKVGDLIKQASDVEKRINAQRELLNRPILEAQRGLKGKADAIFAPLATAVSGVRAKLNAYMQEQQRIADEKRRAAEKAAREAEIAARAAAPAGQDVSAEMQPTITPAKVEAPVARGDLGARVGTRTVWHHEIESVRQLPDRILKNQKVIDALMSVVGAEVRAGAREIKGVKIWSTAEASVR